MSARVRVRVRVRVSVSSGSAAVGVRRYAEGSPVHYHDTVFLMCAARLPRATAFAKGRNKALPRNIAWPGVTVRAFSRLQPLAFAAADGRPVCRTYSRHGR